LCALFGGTIESSPSDEQFSPTETIPRRVTDY
jgi:hypothetical protein